MSQGTEQRSTVAAASPCGRNGRSHSLLEAALLFGAAAPSIGSGVAYLGISLATMLVNGAILLRTSPEMIESAVVPKRRRVGQDRQWRLGSGDVSGAALVAGSMRASAGPCPQVAWHATGAVMLVPATV